MRHFQFTPLALSICTILAVLTTSCEEYVSPLAGASYTAGNQFNAEIQMTWEFIDDSRCQHYRVWKGTVYELTEATYRIYGDRVVILRESNSKAEEYTLSGSLLISSDKVDAVLGSPVTYRLEGRS